MKTEKLSSKNVTANGVNTVLANVAVGDILIPKPEHANKFKKGTKYVVTQSDIDAGNPTIGEYWMKSPMFANDRKYKTFITLNLN